MICPKCKRVYSDNDSFCVECGTRLVKEKTISKETPIERFSNRVKTSKPQQEETPKRRVKKPVKEMTMTDNKLDVLILQNKELINQNKRIIELLEKLVD